VKRLFDEEEHGRISAFVTNLNFLVSAHGVILDSESPIFVAMGGVQTPFALVLNDDTAAYELYVDVPL